MSMAPKLTFNEGKVCDAVLRRVVEREGRSFSNLRRPELGRANAPIDLACEIGGRLFALEHTGIEPFEGHLQLDAQAKTYFKPIESALAEELQPQEHVDLTIPWDAFFGLRGSSAARLQQALIKLVIEAYPTIPVDRPACRARARAISLGDGGRFQIWVHRWECSGFPGRVSVSCNPPNDLETARLARLARVYKTHAKKLAAWQEEQGARTILVLEENDINVTRYDLVFDALRIVERGAERRPDEIWLVNTAIQKVWGIWWLRIGDNYCDDLSAWGTSLSNIDPNQLTNLTER